MSSTSLVLIRHGETAANSQGVWQGSTDSPLNTRGLAQAERVAAHVKEQHAEASAVYASPLSRARETAAPIARTLNLEVRTDPGLSEFHLGDWEGKTYRELSGEHRLWENMRRDPDFAPHGGESPRQVSDRICEALRRIHSDHPGERVIVVTHGGALSLALGRLLHGSDADWLRVMENCGVSELRLEPLPELRSFNHTGHLEGL